MRKIFNLLKICILFSVILICWGCASAPDMISTHKAEGEKYSADDIRRITVDQPFLISGDYFREKNQKDMITINLSVEK